MGNLELTEQGDQLKDTKRAIESLNAKIESSNSEENKQASIVEKNTSDIAQCKNAMAEASDQRKADNTEYLNTLQGNVKAIELIEKAKNKLNQFYNPALAT